MSPKNYLNLAYRKKEYVHFEAVKATFTRMKFV